jgi:hypothetical protein
MLLWRGQDDWTGASHALTLYSLPALLMSGVFALAILEVAQQDRMTRWRTSTDCSNGGTQRAPRGLGRHVGEANDGVRQHPWAGSSPWLRHLHR